MPGNNDTIEIKKGYPISKPPVKPGKKSDSGVPIPKNPPPSSPKKED